jgi:hypothetical protein
MPDSEIEARKTLSNQSPQLRQMQQQHCQWHHCIPDVAADKLLF